MKKLSLFYLTFLITTLAISCNPLSFEVKLESGLLIQEPVSLTNGDYLIKGDSTLASPQITIKGKNIDLDFSGISITGSELGQLPDSFSGLCLLIDSSENITIRNLTIKGYKIALMAKKTMNLTLINCDHSYNYRQKLYSTREKESLTDWLSYHDNERDEWLRYGAAAYIKNYDSLLIKGLKVTQGQNGLMLVNCNDGLIYNNNISFNSGVGIGMYRSSNNRILHNKLDWNVRGYSHGIYQRGQDSAGILVYESCHDNTFAYNSATHSGDGFFLWAGNDFMNTNESGCNGNLILGNDFSHAPTNGIEVTFSSNLLVKNKLHECH